MSDGLITVRVGSGEKLHAATEDGRGLCAAAMRVVLQHGSEVVKVAEGVEGVTCGTCLREGLSYDCSLPGLSQRV